MKKLCVTMLMSISMLSQAGLVDLDNKELVGGLDRVVQI